MAKLGSLFISLIADTAQFSTGLSKARNDLNSTSAIFNRGLASIDKSFSGVARSIKGFGAGLFSIKGAIGALVGIGAGGGLIAMAKQAADSIGGLGELADQLGITTDTLQAFSYAATQVGLSQEELETGIGKLTKTIGDAANGNKAAIDSFNRFGIKILDAQGNVRSTDAVIRDISDAMAKMKDPADRAAIATQLMGRAGQKLIPFLQDGASGIDAFVQQAREMGVVLDRETIAKADEASDKIAALSKILTINFQAALVELAPILAKVAGDLANFTAEVRKFWDTFQSNTSAKSTGGLLEQLDGLQSRLDKLKADKAIQDSSGLSFLGDIFGGNASQDSSIRDIEDQIARTQALIRARRDAVDPFAKTGGATNPTPPVTGTTQAQKDEEEAQKMIADLGRQIDSLESSAVQSKAAEAIAKIGGASSESKIQVASLAAELQLKTEAQKRDAEETAEYLKIIDEGTAGYNKRVDEGKALAESLQTPQEAYKARLDELNAALRTGTIDQQTYNRALLDAQGSYIDTDKNLSLLKESWNDLGDAGVSALEELAINGGSLHDVLMGLLQDLERIALRAGVGAIAQNVFSGVGNWLSNLLTGGGGGGLIGSNAAARGFHSGGIAGGAATFTRSMPASAFAGAPRLHGGGFIGPGEVPAILRRGEGVFTPEQMAAMGGGGSVVVNAPITVNGGGGTPEQNADLAGQISKGVERAVNMAVDKRMGSQLRKGNLLNPGVSV